MCRLFSAAFSHDERFRFGKTRSSVGYGLLNHDEHNTGTQKDDNSRWKLRDAAYNRSHLIIEDKELEIWPNQALVRFKSTEDAGRFFKEFDAVPLSQARMPNNAVLINSASQSTHGHSDTDAEDVPDSLRQIPDNDYALIPDYVVEFKYSLDEQISDLARNGNTAGLTGKTYYLSPETALLTDRILKAYLRRREFGIESICFNTVGQVGTNHRNAPTSEGISDTNPLGGLQVAPYDRSFWWAAPFGYFSQKTLAFYHGCNLLDPGSSAPKSIVGIGQGSGARVAVIDSGFAGGNEAGTGSTRGFPPEIYKTTPIATNMDDGGDNILGIDTSGSWHGRRVASLIFSPTNDSIGTFGVAQAATPFLINVREKHIETAQQVRNAILWALNPAHGIDVINISISWPWYLSWRPLLSPFDDALIAAAKKGVTIVTCAGNRGDDDKTYPGTTGLTINVGGNNIDGQLAITDVDSFGNPLRSNTKNVTLFAPAENVAVASDPRFNQPAVGFLPANGTSFAAPIVAGVVAVGYGKGRISNFTQAKDVLLRTALQASLGGEWRPILNAREAAKASSTVPLESLPELSPLPELTPAPPSPPTTPLWTPGPNRPVPFEPIPIYDPTQYRTLNSKSPSSKTSVAPSPSPTPTPTPTPVPTPKPTPRLDRYYSLTRWQDTAGYAIWGATSKMRHVQLTATDKNVGGVAGEVMWARARNPESWMEIGYHDGSANSAVAGRCYYLAEASTEAGQYQETKILNDTDQVGDERAVRIQRRLVSQGSPQLQLLYQAFLSQKNAPTQWILAGTFGLFREDIASTDHGLEVTARARGTIPLTQQSRMYDILHSVYGTAGWSNPNADKTYTVLNRDSAAPRFKVLHNELDRTPANNVTINHEVP